MAHDDKLLIPAVSLAYHAFIDILLFYFDLSILGTDLAVSDCYRDLCESMAFGSFQMTIPGHPSSPVKSVGIYI